MNGHYQKELRERLLVSKTELSRISGVSMASICRIEKGGTCRSTTHNKLIRALHSTGLSESME